MRLEKLLDTVLGLMLLAVALALFYQVFGRYVIGRAPGWTEEVARMLVAWMAMLGAAACLRGGGHIAVGALVNALAIGEKNWPATPSKGNNAPFKETKRFGLTCPLSASMQATAAPAECPTTMSGFICICVNKAATPAAIPGIENKVATSDVCGIEVKPCPGKSIAITV
jgi:hypothetical protein